MSRVETTTTTLVPHVPTALGSEVEELRGTVEGMRVSKWFTGNEYATVGAYSLGLTPTALPAASMSAAAREAAEKSELLLRTV